MRYDSPQLREQLAAQYVLGTMPVRARRRFERLITADPALARMVGDWADRLSPLDAATAAEEPPARVWRAIERRIAGDAVEPASTPPALPWRPSLAFWRGLALAASAATAALLLYVGLFAGGAPAPAVVAVLAGHGGEPGWVAVAGPATGEVSVSAVAPQPEAKPHAFELWAIAGEAAALARLVAAASGPHLRAAGRPIAAARRRARGQPRTARRLADRVADGAGPVSGQSPDPAALSRRC